LLFCFFKLTAIVVNKESKHSPALYTTSYQSRLESESNKIETGLEKKYQPTKNSFTFVDQIQNKKEKEEEDAFHFHNNNNEAAHMLIDHPFPG